MLTISEAAVEIETSRTYVKLAIHRGWLRLVNNQIGEDQLARFQAARVRLGAVEQYKIIHGNEFAKKS